MPNWTAITESDLVDHKVAALVEALQDAALGVGQSDPTPRIIAEVVSRIRAEIAGCVTNVLDQDEATIPKDLKGLACRMIIREMKNRLETELTEAEKNAETNDLAYLQRINECKVPVAVADNPQTTSKVQAKAGSIRIVRSGPRNFKHSTLDGL